MFNVSSRWLALAYRSTPLTDCALRLAKIRRQHVAISRAVTEQFGQLDPRAPVTRPPSEPRQWSEIERLGERNLDVREAHGSSSSIPVGVSEPYLPEPGVSVATTTKKTKKGLKGAKGGKNTDVASASSGGRAMKKGKMQPSGGKTRPPPIGEAEWINAHNEVHFAGTTHSSGVNNSSSVVDTDTTYSSREEYSHSTLPQSSSGDTSLEDDIHVTVRSLRRNDGDPREITVADARVELLALEDMYRDALSTFKPLYTVENAIEAKRAMMAGVYGAMAYFGSTDDPLFAQLELYLGMYARGRNRYNRRGVLLSDAAVSNTGVDEMRAENETSHDDLYEVDADEAGFMGGMDGEDDAEGTHTRRPDQVRLNDTDELPFQKRAKRKYQPFVHPQEFPAPREVEEGIVPELPPYASKLPPKYRGHWILTTKELAISKAERREDPW